MLNWLERRAQRLAFLRVPALLLAAAGLIAFILTLQLPAILLLIWSLLLYAFLTLFQHLPQPEPTAGWWRRTKLRLLRLAYQLLALLLLLLSLALLALSARGLFVFFSH
jgi:hypothetical protein